MRLKPPYWKYQAEVDQLFIQKAIVKSRFVRRVVRSKKRLRDLRDRHQDGFFLFSHRINKDEPIDASKRRENIPSQKTAPIPPIASIASIAPIAPIAPIACPVPVEGNGAKDTKRAPQIPKKSLVWRLFNLDSLSR